MIKKVLLVSSLVLASIFAHAQVGIGTTSPSNALDVETNEAGGTAIDINNTGTGDPKINLQLNGTTTFSIGVDNDDADKLKIGTTAPETNTRITIDNAGNVGVGTSTPDQSAILDAYSTTKGFLPPRLTTTQRNAITNPATGLVVFNTTTGFMEVNVGTPLVASWQVISPGATGPTGPTGATGATGPTGLLTAGNTAGNTPYWNGTSWVVNSSNIFNNGGNVGIGETNPTTKLHVAGSFRLVNGTQAAGKVLTSDANGVATWQTASGGSLPAGTSGQTLRHDGTNWVANSTIFNNGTNVGIGTVTPNAPLQFANVAANRKIALFDMLNNDHQFTGLGINNAIFRYQVDAITTSHVFYAGTSSTTSNELMRIQGNGRVGIGTAAPSSTLHVIGTSSFDGATVINETGAAINFRVESSGNQNMFVVNGTNNSVGIGTESPINAALQFANVAANRKIVLYDNGNGNEHQFSGLGINNAVFRYQVDAISTSHVFYAGTSSTTSNELMRIQGNGRVGIGTASPDQTLSVNGNASKVGGGSWATFSDKRLKKNINEFKDGLNKLMQINPVSFQYNGLAGYTNDSTSFVGVIAQDVEKVAPYMIKHVQKKLNENDSTTTDLLMYDASALTYILVNAVKEQQAIIEAQKKEIEILKADLDIKSDKNTSEINLLKAQVQQLLQLIQKQETVSVSK